MLARAFSRAAAPPDFPEPASRAMRYRRHFQKRDEEPTRAGQKPVATNRLHWELFSDIINTDLVLENTHARDFPSNQEKITPMRCVETTPRLFFPCCLQAEAPA
jgi:hypothetical protein